MNPADLLAGLRRTLIEITNRTPSTRELWDENRVLQLAMMKLWIDAGNYAEAYRKAPSVPHRISPWSDLVGYRGFLSHELPENVGADRFWDETHDASELLAEVNAAAQH